MPSFLKQLDARLAIEARELIAKSLLPQDPSIGTLNTLADFKNGRPVAHLLIPRDKYALRFLMDQKLIRHVRGRNYGWILNLRTGEVGERPLEWNYSIDHTPNWNALKRRYAPYPWEAGAK